MNAPTLPSTFPRLQALDSMRGIAAFTVLLGHTLALCDWNTDIFNFPFLNNFFDGRSAVTMFFVLSGFVLTFGQLATGKEMPLLPFYVRRVTRIWIPWFFFFILSILAKHLIFSHPVTIPPLSEHHLMFWSKENSPYDLFKQLFYSLHDAERMFLPQDWSLGVELRASAMIPFFLFLIKKNWAWLAAAGIALLFFKPGGGGYYYASFVLGVLTAALSTRLHNFRYPGFIAFLGYALYQVRWANGDNHGFDLALGEAFVWMTSAIGCGLMIFGVLKSPSLRALLEWPPFVFLGTVSYSCYLIQVIILLCVAPWILVFLNHLGIHSPSILQVLLLATVTAICLALSWLGERWVEIPCIRFGKFLTARMQQASHLPRWKV